MINVALTNESFAPQVDGVAVCVENYAKIINQKYGKSHVFVPAHEGRSQLNFDFPIYEYPTTRITVADQYRVGLPITRLSKKISNIDIDLVHSHCPFVSGIVAQRIAAKKKVPHISTFHSKFKDDINSRLKTDLNLAGELVAKYVSAYYRQCDYVWAVNYGTAKTLAEYGYKGEVTVMPNGCDMPATYRDDEIRSRLCKEHGMNEQYPIFLFVGRMTNLKNVDKIIKALAVLSRHGRKFNMLFVGSGENFEDTNQLVLDNQLSNCVKFAGKVMDRGKLCEIYSSSDLLIFPSVYDNAPLVVREAAACGCASLLIKDSNSAEGILSSQNGYLVQETVEDIAFGIDEALRSNRLFEIGKKARDTIYVPWEIVVERVVQEYEKVCIDWKKNHQKREKYQNSDSFSDIDLIKDFNLKTSRKKNKEE